MPTQTLSQRFILGIGLALFAAIAGLVSSLFRVDAFTGSDALQMENRIITRLNECREETRNDIIELREAGQYHIERLDNHLEEHE